MVRFALMAMLFFSTAVVNAQPTAKPDFAHDVVPLLKAKCAQCHTNGTYKGGISFDTREDLLKAKAAVPGKSATSEMILRVTSQDPETRMPPKGDALMEKEVNTLKA